MAFLYVVLLDVLATVADALVWAALNKRGVGCVEGDELKNRGLP